MSKQTNFSLVLIALLISACSTARVPFIKDVTDDTDRTTFLLGYELKPMGDLDWKEDCTIEITQTSSGSTDSVPVSLRKKQLQVEVPPGKYKFGVLSCGRSEHWDLENFGAPTITASAGKVNFLGKFIFEISKSKNVNELNINRGNRDDTRKSLIEIARKKAPHWKKRVVSAYNGGSIPDTYFQNEEAYKRGSISHVVGPKATLNLMKFDDCERFEFRTNPTPLGVLSFHVSYENDEFSKMNTVANTHSFSADYVHCVEKVLKDFKPGYKGKVDYDINF